MFQIFLKEVGAWSSTFTIPFYGLFCIKVLQDNAKSRRELALHWKAGACPFIVKIKEIYENKFMKKASLLAVMEWYVALGGTSVQCFVQFPPEITYP